MSSPAHRANSDANPSDKTRNAHSDSELVQRLVLVNALQVEASMCLDPEGILAQAHLPAVFADRSVWIGLVSADGKELTPSVLAAKELDPTFGSILRRERRRWPPLSRSGGCLFQTSATAWLPILMSSTDWVSAGLSRFQFGPTIALWPR